MALSDHDIVIFPNKGQTSDPKIVFSGADATTGAKNITLRVYPTNNGTVSFEGSVGQLLSVSNTMSGSIFSVNDISGIPSIDVDDTGVVKIAPYNGRVEIGGNLAVTGGYRISSGSILAPASTDQATAYVNGGWLQICSAGNGITFNNNANGFATLMSMSNAGAVTIPGSVVVSGSSFSYTRASGSMFIDVTSGTNKSYFGWDTSISGGPATAIESDGAFAISTGGAYTTSRFRIETTGAVTIPGTLRIDESITLYGAANTRGLFWNMYGVANSAGISVDGATDGTRIFIKTNNVTRIQVNGDGQVIVPMHLAVDGNFTIGTNSAASAGAIFNNGTWGMGFVAKTASTYVAGWFDSSVNNIMALTSAGGLYLKGTRWFRNDTSGYGLFNDATGAHFYSSGNGNFNLTGNVSTNAQLVLRHSYGGAATGYLYSDGSGFGFLARNAAWSILIPGDAAGGGILTGPWYAGSFTAGGASVSAAPFEVKLGNDGIVMYQSTDNQMKIQSFIDAQWAARTTYATGANALQIQTDAGMLYLGYGGGLYINTTGVAIMNTNGIVKQHLYVRHVEGKDYNNETTTGNLYLNYDQTAPVYIGYQGKVSFDSSGNIGGVNLLTAAGITVSGGTSSTITMVDSNEGDRSIHCNSNRIGFLKQDGNWGSWCEDDGAWGTIGYLSASSGLSKYGASLSAAPSTVATNWYRILTMSGSNQPMDAEIYIRSNGLHTGTRIKVGKGTGYYRCEAYTDGRYAYNASIKRVRIVNVGVNSPVYVDVQFGEAATHSYDISVDTRGSTGEISLNALVDQGSTATGHVYEVWGYQHTWGSNEFGQNIRFGDDGEVQLIKTSYVGLANWYGNAGSGMTGNGAWSTLKVRNYGNVDVGIGLYGNGNAWAGTVYADGGGNIGFLNSASAWALKFRYSDNYLSVGWLSASYIEAATYRTNQGSQTPSASFPGVGIRPFYYWGGVNNSGNFPNDGTGFSNGISIGAHPGDPNYGFQFVNNMWDDDIYHRSYYSGAWQGYKRIVSMNTNKAADVRGAFAVTGYGNITAGSEDRPSLRVSGSYPEIVVMAGGAGNGNHGGTISIGSYDSGTSGAVKMWVLGTNGTGSTWLDIGYGTSTNPHLNGVGGYGTNVMRLNSDQSVVIRGRLIASSNYFDTSANGDVRTARNGGTSGTYYFGTGDRYLHYDGSNFTFGGQNVYAGTFYGALSGNAATASSAVKLDGANAYTNGSDGWFRSNGDAGWYSATYAVGIYSTGASWVSTYNGSNFAITGSYLRLNGAARKVKSDGTNTGFTDGSDNLCAYVDGANAFVVTNTLWLSGNPHIYKDAPTIYLRDTDGRSCMLHNNGNRFYLLRGTGNASDSWATSNGYWPMDFNLDNNDVTLGGNVTAAYNITAYSDERLKKDWTDIPANIVEKLAKVKNGTYTRIDISQLRQIGVSAQSLREVLPEAVMEADNEEKMLSVSYGNAALAMCVELAKEIVLLKEEINKLKGVK